MRRVPLFLIFIFLPTFALAAPQKSSSSFFTNSVITQALGKTETPLDLNNLPTNWWNYFETDKEAFPSHVENFRLSVNSQISNLSNPNSEKAQSIIKKINNNLDLYLQFIKQPTPATQPTTTIYEHYSIEDILSLNHQIEKREIELKATKDDRKEKSRQLGVIQELLNKEIKLYNKAEARSEEKILFALELISYKTALEVKKKNIEYLEKIIFLSTSYINELSEELETATTRIKSDSQEVKLFGQRLTQSQKEWEQKSAGLISKEAEVAKAESEPISDGAEAKLQYLHLQLLHAKIEEMNAHNLYLLNQISFRLAKLLVEPEKTIGLTQIVNEWEKSLDQFKQQTLEWTNQTQKLVQRYGQIIFIKPPEEDKEATANRARDEQIFKTAQDNLLLLQKLSNNVHDALLLLKLLDSRTYYLLGATERWAYKIALFAKESYSTAQGWLNYSLVQIGNTPITPVSILRFLIIILFTIWASRLIIRGLTKLASRQKGIHKSLVYRVNRLVHYFILALGIFIALSSIGFDLSSFVLIAGALGVGLGFGLQSIFNNFISGIIILFESHIKVGDFIELESKIRGEVREINVRSTIITTNDGIDVLIPNSEIISNKVINWTLKDPYRRVLVPFTVPYGTDKEAISKIIVEAAKKVPKTLFRVDFPDPVVYLTRFGANGLDFELAVWVNEKFTKHTHSTISDYLWAIDSALAAHGIKVPVNEMEVTVRHAHEPPHTQS